MLRSRIARVLVPAALSLALAGDDAPARCHRRRAACTPRAAIAASCAPSPAVGYAPTPQAGPQGPSSAGPGPGESAGNFLAWLNSTRAAHGLAPVGWDPGLAADASANSSRGFGHAHFGRARRQNVGVGGLGAVSAAWLASPAHASALLDPGLRAVGLANVGGIWTYSAN